MVLTVEIIQKGLSQVARTVDETGENYAFVKLDVAGKEITSFDTALEGYPHLRYISASDNAITDLSPLATLPNLLAVDLARNQITDVAAVAIPNENLQVINLAENSLKSAAVAGPPPLLTCLNVTKNAIESLSGLDTLPSLERLEGGGNPTLTTTDGIGAAVKLKFLMLQSCGLQTPDPPAPPEGDGEEGEAVQEQEQPPAGPGALQGMEGLESLEVLDISGNQVSILGDLTATARAEESASTLVALRKIVAANNKVTTLEDVATLALLPGLTDLDLRDNDVTGSDNYRQEVMILLPRLNMLDGEKVTPEEREEVKGVMKERGIAAAEAAAAEAAAAAAAEDDE